MSGNLQFMLTPESAIRSYLKEEARLQKGKYKLRNTVYVFACIRNCGKEIEVRKADLKRCTGRCRSCADRETASRSSITNSKEPFEALYNRFLYDRERYGQKTSLSFAEFLRFTGDPKCHYCDEPVVWAKKALAKNGYGYHLDRKDCNGIYSAENCVVCCWRCNQTKSNRFSYQEFLLMAPMLREIERRRKLEGKDSAVGRREATHQGHGG